VTDLEYWPVVVKNLIEALQEREERARGWISVKDRMPEKARGEDGVLGLVNGYNGRITFIDAYIIVRYDYVENAWWSEDYDIEGCTISHWIPLPGPPCAADR